MSYEIMHGRYVAVIVRSLDPPNVFFSVCERHASDIARALAGVPNDCDGWWIVAPGESELREWPRRVKEILDV